MIKKAREKDFDFNNEEYINAKKQKKRPPTKIGGLKDLASNIYLFFLRSMAALIDS